MPDDACVPLNPELAKWNVKVDTLRGGDFGTAYLITHYHADHTRGHRRKSIPGTIYASEYTCKRLCKFRCKIIKVGEPFKVNGLWVRAFDAGHMEGSLMLYFEQPHILYTSDYTRIPKGIEKVSVVYVYTQIHQAVGST
jgi:Cft2 family RNA processing exonuclease